MINCYKKRVLTIVEICSVINNGIKSAFMHFSEKLLVIITNMLHFILAVILLDF